MQAIQSGFYLLHGKFFEIISLSHFLVENICDSSTICPLDGCAKHFSTALQNFIQLVSHVELSSFYWSSYFGKKITIKSLWKFQIIFLIFARQSKSFSSSSFFHRMIVADWSYGDKQNFCSHRSIHVVWLYNFIISKKLDKNQSRKFWIKYLFLV